MISLLIELNPPRKESLGMQQLLTSFLTSKEIVPPLKRKGQFTQMNDKKVKGLCFALCDLRMTFAIFEMSSPRKESAAMQQSSKSYLTSATTISPTVTQPLLLKKLSFFEILKIAMGLSNKHRETYRSNLRVYKTF